jgi:hypothetical protein
MLTKSTNETLKWWIILAVKHWSSETLKGQNIKGIKPQTRSRVGKFQTRMKWLIILNTIHSFMPIQDLGLAITKSGSEASKEWNLKRVKHRRGETSKQWNNEAVKHRKDKTSNKSRVGKSQTRMKWLNISNMIHSLCLFKSWDSLLWAKNGETMKKNEMWRKKFWNIHTWFLNSVDFSTFLTTASFFVAKTSSKTSGDTSLNVDKYSDASGPPRLSKLVVWKYF